MEYALSILPYDHKKLSLTDAQREVERILAKYVEDTQSPDVVDVQRENIRQQLAEGFAEYTMQQIEEEERMTFISSPNLKRNVFDKLADAAKHMMDHEYTVHDTKPTETFQTVIYLTDEQKMDRMEMEENGVHTMNYIRIDILQRWEAFKRQALDQLTIEIETIQTMTYGSENKTCRDFDTYRDGVSSTPKCSDEKENDKKNNEEKDKENDKESDIENDIKNNNKTDIKKDNKNDSDKDCDKENEPLAELDDDDEEYVPNKTIFGKRGRKSKSVVTSTPKRTCPEFEFDTDASAQMITIGPNGTKVARASLEGINWSASGPAITRKLLCEVFDRKTLAFHTLSGKPSPAFRDCARPSKQQLDPAKVADLVYLMTTTMQMTPREVRTAITTKCADENKMLRSRNGNPRRGRKSI